MGESAEPNLLYYGDNLDILRRYVKDETVDLVYLDPPFNSNASYNVLFKERSGKRSTAQIHAFEDTWEWGLEAERAYEDIIRGGGKVADAMQAFRRFLGTNDMLAYLVMMAPRLVELHRVLKPTGSIYLHCDPTASHYLKMLLDAIFGPLNYRNEVTWKRTSAHSDARTKYADVADIILFYAKSEDTPFHVVRVPLDPEYVRKFYRHVDENGRRYRLDNLRSPNPRPNLTYDYKGFKPHAKGWAVSRERMEQLDEEGRLHFPSKPDGRIQLKRFLDENAGAPVSSLWTDIRPIGAQAAERMGYPTQKPEALLERIIKASSNEGDTVLDPFCGCGTTIVAAQRLNRRWIGIDVTHLAINLMKRRLRDTFGKDAEFEVVGEPQDLSGAEALAKQDPYQFQWWALDLVDARPTDQKKGADKGIDGRIPFLDDKDAKEYKEVIISVKAGHVTVSHVRDLRGVLDRESAAIGLLLSLEEPTGPMKTEAASAGFYHSPAFGKDFPRIQLLTVGELLDGRKPELPPSLTPDAAFKRAPRARKGKGGQEKLGV